MKVIIISVVAAISVVALVLGLGLGFGLPDEPDLDHGFDSDSDTNSTTLYEPPRTRSNLTHQIAVHAQTGSACIRLYARRSGCAGRILVNTSRSCGCGYQGGLYEYVDCDQGIYYWDCTATCDACNELINFNVCYGQNNNAMWTTC